MEVEKEEDAQEEAQEALPQAEGKAITQPIRRLGAATLCQEEKLPFFHLAKCFAILRMAVARLGSPTTVPSVGCGAPYFVWRWLALGLQIPRKYLVRLWASNLMPGQSGQIGIVLVWFCAPAISLLFRFSPYYPSCLFQW